MLLFIASCGDPHGDAEPVPDPVEKSRVVVESHLPEIESVMVEAARKRAVRRALVDVIDEEAARPFGDRVEDGLRYSTVFDREYVDAEVDPAFVEETGMTMRGAAVVDLLDETERHGLDVETLHRTEIAERRELAEQDPVEPFEVFSPTAREVEALVELVADAVDDDAEAGAALLIDVVSTVDDGDDQPEELERFRDYTSREADQFAPRARTLAELELLVADASLRYAREMRHGNLERVDWEQLRVMGGSTEVILRRMQGTLAELVAADPDEVVDVFQGLEPSHPQYRGLLGATDRYRRFVNDGGWDRVPPFQVEYGSESARVEALRDRLEAEGYDARPDEPTDDFDPRVVDDALIDGIRAYQETHQFEPDGDPTYGFWRSLNTSADERLEQMELTLQRWRESHLEDDDDFILVNIPKFRAEVWSEGQRQLDFRVVVGNNSRRCDRETEQWVYPDATPTLASTMDHVMVNPPWYVPGRIVEQTLEPRLEENEDYYDEEGYEVVEMADGREVVRQNPGDDNALGRAKFIFPNEHNVYLHDTPDRHYFDYGIRAYSHGCIRVAEPMRLAEFLFDWMGRDDLDIDEMTDDDRTFRIDFEDELPVMLEYYTVWVDDEGRPNFLADIYDRDAQRLSDEPDEYFECNPATHIADDEPEVAEGEDDAPDDLDEDIGP